MENISSKIHEYFRFSFNHSPNTLRASNSRKLIWNSTLARTSGLVIGTFSPPSSKPSPSNELGIEKEGQPSDGVFGFGTEGDAV